MKNFMHPSFFRLFDRLLDAANPGLKRSSWTYEGVEFERDRHSFVSSRYGVTMEVFTLTHSGRHSWRLLVSKEYWYLGEQGGGAKNLRWARPIAGRHTDILSWLRQQELTLDRVVGGGGDADRNFLPPAAMVPARSE